MDDIASISTSYPVPILLMRHLQNMNDIATISPSISSSTSRPISVNNLIYIIGIY